jgi:ABC-type glycerol-3-phosphate transport system substrate-binding protein
MVWNEKVIAGPFFFDSGLVLYRKDILERNGFTIDNFTTWTNWKVNLNKMLDNATEAALNPNLEGYAFQGDSYEGGIVNLIEWMGASGGSFVNSAGKANFVASAVPALTWMKGLVPITPPIFLPPLLNANPLNNPIGDFVSKRSELVGDEDSAVTTWLAGNTIFQRNWPFSQKSSSIDAIMNGSQVLKFENGTIYNANLIADPWFVNHPNESRFGVTTLPYNAEHCGAENEQGCRSAVSGGAVFGIPKTSMHIEQAKLFLQEIASKPFQLAMAINGSGNSPFSKEIYIDGSLNGTSQEFKIELFQSVFIHTFPRPILPEYVTISQTIQPIYHNGFSGALSVLEALAEMDLQVNIILGNILPTNTITVRENFTVNFTVTNQVTKTVTTPAFDLLIIILTLGVFRFKASRRKLKKITSKSGH